MLLFHQRFGCYYIIATVKTFPQWLTSAYSRQAPICDVGETSDPKFYLFITITRKGKSKTWLPQFLLLVGRRTKHFI